MACSFSKENPVSFSDPPPFRQQFYQASALGWLNTLASFIGWKLRRHINCYLVRLGSVMIFLVLPSALNICLSVEKYSTVVHVLCFDKYVVRLLWRE